MSFWIILGVMTVAALAVVLLPLLRARGAFRDRDAENLEIYRRRLRALEGEVAEGVLPPEEVEATRAEIEKRLLEDVHDGADASPETTAKQPLRWAVFAAILVALPLGAIGLYTALGVNPQTLERANAAGGGRMATDEMPELVESLARRLRENPDNGEGWLLLGRSYLFLEQPDKAAEAFAKAQSLLGDDPNLLVDYANALAMASGGNLQGRPELLLHKALAQAPDDPRALWFAGLAAAQGGDPARARTHWRNLLQQLDPESEDAAAVRRRLAQLGGEQSDVPAVAAGEEGRDAGSEAAGIAVTVTLAQEIASGVAPEDPVFVFARAAEGPPLPLAAVRRRVGDLPFTVRLDDDDAMMPGRMLSSADRIVVGARISRGGGGPIPRSGDLQGISQVLRLSETDEIRVMIDSVVP